MRISCITVIPLEDFNYIKLIGTFPEHGRHMRKISVDGVSVTAQIHKILSNHCVAVA